VPNSVRDAPVGWSQGVHALLVVKNCAAWCDSTSVAREDLEPFSESDHWPLCDSRRDTSRWRFTRRSVLRGECQVVISRTGASRTALGTAFERQALYQSGRCQNANVPDLRGVS
jgi:hypothetical protein